MASLSKLAWTAAKLAACGMIVVAIAFGFVVINPDGDVDEAGADVFWFGPSSLSESKHSQFLKFLESEGFSEPQAYDYNGNIIYMSVNESTESPHEASGRLQQSLINHGINNHAYPVPPDPTIIESSHENPGELNEAEIAYSVFAAEDYFSGGLVPIIDTGDYIALSGVETKAADSGVDDLAGLMEALYSTSGHDLNDFFTNFRHLEFIRPEGAQKTQKIAVFGDGAIDFENFRPGAGGLSAEITRKQQIPACPGCERNTNLSGKDSLRHYSMTTYNSPDSEDGVLAFYDQTLLARGWSRLDQLSLVQQMRLQTAPHYAPDRPGKLVGYALDDRIVHIHVEPAERVGTYVNIFTGQ